MIYHRDNCRLCGSKDVVLALPLTPTAIADAYTPRERLAPQATYPLDLYLCQSCGHVQLLDVIPSDILFKDYIYVSASSLNLDPHFRAYSSSVISKLGLKPGQQVLDIGSNDGTLLRLLKEKDLRVLGVDPAREIALKSTAAGIETIPAFYTSELGMQLRTERGPMDLVTANNVYAHADNLADMTDGIRNVLAPKGIFVFEVSYLLDQLEGMVFDYVYHEHLCYHSVKPLRVFLARHGLELVDVERVGTKGGSIRGFAQLKGGPWPVKPSVNEFVAAEDAAGLDRLETYQKFSKRIDDAKRDLNLLLDRLESEGKRIAGFGASATSTTLIYHFGLGSRLECIYDDNSQRHNLFSPGFHIPVVSPAKMSKQHPDAVVLLAWRFVDPVSRHHQDYLRNGGQFIVPLPKLSIVKLEENAR
jgi:SAM-dependent methyltransferase